MGGGRPALTVRRDGLSAQYLGLPQVEVRSAAPAPGAEKATLESAHAGGSVLSLHRGLGRLLTELLERAGDDGHEPN